MKQFRAGVNPGGEFAFHFTTLGNAESITISGQIWASESGLAGEGVYLGKLSAPGPLRNIPFVGYGLELSKKTRIPVFLSESIQTGLRDPLIPLFTYVFGNGESLPLTP